MKKRIFQIYSLCFLAFVTTGCSNDSESEPIETKSRNFKMGFTTWSFGPNLQDVDNTYTFIANNADVYVEHLDNNIPWDAWINDLPLPMAFTNEIEGKANRKIPGKDLVLSVGLLNLNRDDLSPDLDGTVPTYVALNDEDIQKAYAKHIDYLVGHFSPDYLVIAIEVNELWLRNNALWDGYVLLINKVIAETKTTFPNLKISVSVSLHNLFDADVSSPDAYVNAVFEHINQMDFVAISYYPFLKSQNRREQFQATLDFLHTHTNKPIAFVESGHIAEDLVIPGLGVSINGNPTEQNLFLETLFTNAKTQDYEMVNWWAYRDYDALWEVFPDELKDVGQLWRDTGLIDENARERPSLNTWQTYLLE